MLVAPGASGWAVKLFTGAGRDHLVVERAPAAAELAAECERRVMAGMLWTVAVAPQPSATAWLIRATEWLLGQRARTLHSPRGHARHICARCRSTSIVARVPTTFVAYS